MPCGEMAERLNVPDSKSGVRVSAPGVRIPLSPPPEPLAVVFTFCNYRYPPKSIAK